MQKTLAAIRSLIYVLFLAVTVVPYAIAVLIVSIFIRGSRLYWFTIGWLRLSIWGARVICGVPSGITALWPPPMSSILP